MLPSTDRRVIVCSLVVFLSWLVHLLPAKAHITDWQRLSSSRRVESTHNDGDSIAVRVGSDVTVFRLYFVDTLETNPRSEARLTEQARLFGIPPTRLDAARSIAARAAQRTRQLTARPFTVHTKWQRVDPEGGNPSIRAFIETDEGDLGQILVSEGLALIKSGSALSDHPDGRSIAQQLIDLRQRERSARQSKLGAWASLQRSPPQKLSPLDELLARQKQSQGEYPDGHPGDSEKAVFSALDLEELTDHIGKVAAVRGRLGHIGALPGERIVFLNFEGVPRGGFCGITHNTHLDALRAAFGPDFPYNLEGEEVELTGLVTEYRGIPQVELKEPQQVKLIGPNAQ